MERIPFENYPSTDYPVNSDNLNKLQDNVEESLNEPGVYLLASGNYQVGDSIPLTDSIDNYDFIIIATGTVGTGETGYYLHTIVLPFHSEFTLGEKTRAIWRDNDVIVAAGQNGINRLTITSKTELYHASTTTSGADSYIRGVYGVKLF